MKRITLRLPDDLHEQLVKEAGEYNRSLNAQIVTYLQTRLPAIAELIEQSKQKSPTLTHAEFIEQAMARPGVRAEYERIGPWFDKLFEKLDAKLRKRTEELSQLATMPEDQIDTSDIPEQLDWSDAKRGLFHQEATKPL